METNFAHNLRILQSYREKRGSSEAKSDPLEAIVFHEEEVEALQNTRFLLGSLSWKNISDENYLELKRQCMALWSSVIYHLIQTALSHEEGSFPSLDILLSTSLNLLEAISFTCADDPVFQCSMASMIAMLLYQLKEFHACIGLAVKYIDVINQLRSHYITSLFNPSSTIPLSDEILASIQLNSFLSCPRELKPIEALQGSSVINRRLSELHCDLIALYFRSELRICMDSTEDSKRSPISNLKCISQLKVFCFNNSYYLCALYREMASMESAKPLQLSLLKLSRLNLNEAERKEKALLSSFLLDRASGALVSKQPVVVARTHESIILLPATDGISGKASYCSIFAREKHTGAPVTSRSNTLSGCEVMIQMEALHGPDISLQLSRISGLIEGEEYMFSSGCYSNSGELIGSPSESTFPIEAVNPLPTAVLLGSLCFAANALDQPSIVLSTANDLLSQFTREVPSSNSILTKGKGINLFLGADLVIDMEALSTASAVVISSVLRAFVASSTINFRDLTERQKAADIKSIFQLRLLSSLRATAAMSYFAIRLQSIEQIFELVRLGTRILSQLQYLGDVQTLMGPSAYILLAAMQTVPISHWRTDDYAQYRWLLELASKTSLTAQNTSASALVSGFLAEVVTSLPTTLFDSYYALYLHFKAYPGTLLIPSALNKFQTLFSVESEQHKTVGLWKLSSCQRREVLSTSALCLMEPKLSADGAM